MANEILKDEILSDEELDQVAGGTDDQTDMDIAHFFNIRWRIDFPDDWDEAVVLLKNMYKKAGVDFEANERKPNVYRAIVNGEVGCTISRDEALHALENYVQQNKKPANYIPQIRRRR